MPATALIQAMRYLHTYRGCTVCRVFAGVCRVAGRRSQAWPAPTKALLIRI